MRVLIWFQNWLASAEHTPKYTAFIKVAGIRVPVKIKNLFQRAASGKISHDDLRAEYIQKRGLRRE